MRHYYSLANGKEIAVDINCNHPEVENNTCPTGTGDCANCGSCKVTMSAIDFFALKENGFKKKEDSNEMTEVVINVCFGGFGLSNDGVRAYLKRKGLPCYEKVDKFNDTHFFTSPKMDDESYFSYYDIKRDDPDLVAIVKELGKRANGGYASLHIVKVPANVQWIIEEYDGIETVEEVHRSFY